MFFYITYLFYYFSDVTTQAWTPVQAVMQRCQTAGRVYPAGRTTEVFFYDAQLTSSADLIHTETANTTNNLF